MRFTRANAPNEGGDELLNFSEIAREFHVSQRTIARLVAEGALKAVRPRKWRKIARRELVRYFGQPAERRIA